MRCVMKSIDLQEFLYRNKLKSVDLVEYWGVTKGVVSQFLKGTTKLPAKRIEQLLNNPYGWDTSMLTDSSPLQTGAVAQPLQSDYEILIAELRAQIERLEGKIDNLNQELGEKNALLKLMRQGGEDSAQDAGCSLSANVG